MRGESALKRLSMGQNSRKMPQHIYSSILLTFLTSYYSQTEFCTVIQVGWLLALHLGRQDKVRESKKV